MSNVHGADSYDAGKASSMMERADGALAMWRMGIVDEVGLTLGATEKVIGDAAHTATGRNLSHWEVADWARAIKSKVMTNTAWCLSVAMEMAGLRSEFALRAARTLLSNFAYPAGNDARRDWFLLAIRFTELSKVQSDPQKAMAIAVEDADREEFRTAMTAAIELTRNGKSLDEAIVLSRVPNAAIFAKRLHGSAAPNWLPLFEGIVASERRALPSIAAFDPEAQRWAGSTDGLALAEVIGWYRALAHLPEPLANEISVRRALEELPPAPAAAWRSVLFEKTSSAGNLPAFDAIILRRAFVLGRDLRTIAATLAELETADYALFNSRP